MTTPSTPSPAAIEAAKKAKIDWRAGNCAHCGRPLATQADYDAIPEDDDGDDDFGKCWAEFEGLACSWTFSHIDPLVLEMEISLTAAYAIDRPHIEAEKDAEIERLRGVVAEYEHQITWGVTCANCANLLDRCFEADMHLDTALAQLAAIAGWINENERFMPGIIGDLRAILTDSSAVAEYERRVKAEAWDEGYRHMFDHPFSQATENPYRADAQAEGVES